MTLILTLISEDEVVSKYHSKQPLNNYLKYSKKQNPTIDDFFNELNDFLEQYYKDASAYKVSNDLTNLKKILNYLKVSKSLVINNDVYKTIDIHLSPANSIVNKSKLKKRKEAPQSTQSINNESQKLVEFIVNIDTNDYKDKLEHLTNQINEQSVYIAKLKQEIEEKNNKIILLYDKLYNRDNKI